MVQIIPCVPKRFDSTLCGSFTEEEAVKYASTTDWSKYKPNENDHRYGTFVDTVAIRVVDDDGEIVRDFVITIWLASVEGPDYYIFTDESSPSRLEANFHPKAKFLTVKKSSVNAWGI